MQPAHKVCVIQRDEELQIVEEVVKSTGLSPPAVALMRTSKYESRCGEMNREVAAYLTALLIGIAFASWLFPTDLLFPTDYYNLPASGDLAHQIIGQRYFLLDQWQYPLLVTKLLRWPEGISIAFTDSIPLVALPAKLVRRFLPPGFHGIFLFLAISWILQPVAAVFALRSAGERRFVPALAIAVIAISMPTLLYRSGLDHQALCAHFLILFAIGVYFRTCGGSNVTLWTAPPILLVASLLVHPYLMAMVAAVLLAAPLSLVFRRDPRWVHAAVAFVAGAIVTAGLGFLFGYSHGVRPTGGYGYFSMNLLSPIDPAQSSLVPFFPTLVDATGGQFEGYQYLGLGVLCLCTISLLWIAGRMPLRMCARHVGLLAMALGLTLFALSNTVFNGTFMVVHDLPLPILFNSFRSSGRFFWPVAYLLVLGAIVCVSRRLRYPVAAVVLLAAACLQFADASALRNAVRDHTHRQEKWEIDRATLEPLMQHSSQLTLWPRYECLPRIAGDPKYYHLLMLASQYGLRTNTVFTPSPASNGSCRAADVIGMPLSAGELRIILPQGETPNAEVPNAREQCRPLGPLIVCSTEVAGK